MQIVVTGATGFIGRPLCRQLCSRDHSVTALSRDPERARQTLGERVRSLAWSENETGWQEAVQNADAVIHLAGEPIAGRRWTDAYRERIRASRVETTRRLAQAITSAPQPPRTLLSASAVGYYGDTGDRSVTEKDPPGTDFLARVCQQWEAAATAATTAGVRVALLRIGIVLGPGAALQKMLYPLPLPVSPWKLGLGGPLGNGRQWMPWIHLDDVIGLFVWALEQPRAEGAINLTAPDPVRNRDFARALGQILGRPALLPVPAFALKALVGDFASFLLSGQRVLPAAALQGGYRFRYPTLDEALRQAVAGTGGP